MTPEASSFSPSLKPSRPHKIMVHRTSIHRILLQTSVFIPWATDQILKSRSIFACVLAQGSRAPPIAQRLKSPGVFRSSGMCSVQVYRASGYCELRLMRSFLRACIDSTTLSPPACLKHTQARSPFLEVTPPAPLCDLYRHDQAILLC